MTIDSIDVESTLARVRELLANENDLAPAVRSTLEVLLLLVTALINRLGLNSKNSSTPPAQDPNRKKNSKPKNNNNRGGQNGHIGKTLEPVSDPDDVVTLPFPRKQLPQGNYRRVGYEKRQVLDIQITRNVTEYQAEVLEDAHGRRFTAPFPAGVTRPIQYGNGVKAHAVYLSQYQLLPYKRIEEYFADQFDLPISAGSLYNFNTEASTRLHPFMPWVKNQLLDEPLLHADETGVNIDGKRHWLHCLSSPRLTCFDVHTSRGHEAMDAIGVLPHFTATLCHDHWKPYYRYQCTHALCNAHHLRELERAWEQDGQQWAKAMQELLREINRAVDKAGGVLTAPSADNYRQRYRSILTEGDSECPPPDESQRSGKRGRVKRSKARNLLERLREFEDDTLRFMTLLEVPFTNNLGERDIRMTKVHQKISGCFRSFKGAQTFCRVRSYVSTCRKNIVSASEALSQLFAGKWPDFITLP